MSLAALPHKNIDMAACLLRQKNAFVQQGPPSLLARRQSLKRLRKLTCAYRTALVEAVAQDFSHRSHHETCLMELTGVIQAIDYLHRRLHRWMRPERRHVGAFYQMGKAYVHYQPKGVVGVMAPWNYPIALTLIPVATALAAGNRVMLKPSELTPRTAEVLDEMLSQAFDAEHLQVVLGDASVGAQFSALAFDHLLFTGSTHVGRQVMQAASQHLVPITLELGGKSPAVVARGHASLRTLDKIVFGKLANAGQTCVAPDYALVHADDLKAFTKLFAESTARFYPEGTQSRDYTSIVNERHFDRLVHLIEDAQAKGAHIMQIGHTEKTGATRKRVLAPTLVLDAPDDALVWQEEIFGPILPIRTYQTWQSVIDAINARPRPLACYYFGPENAEYRLLEARTTSGNLGVNHTLMHVAQDDLPFGGIGPSGMGAYHGIEGFRAMSHAKGVFIQKRWNLPAFLHAPFGRMANLAIDYVLGKAP